MKKLRNNARGYILDMFAQHHMVKRTVLSFLSIVIMGFGTALFNVSGFGVDPFTSMNMSVAAVLGISFGTYQLIINAVILLYVVIVAHRGLVGVGTVFNMAGVGYSCELFSSLLMPMVKQNDTLSIRIPLLLAGILVLCFACSLFFTANIGVGPYDALGFMLSRFAKLPYKWVRVLTDVTVVSIGLLVSGGFTAIAHGDFASIQNIGIGTVITAFCMGPLINFFNKTLSAKIPKGARVIPLCIEGRELSSAQLAARVADFSQQSSHLVFVIGGSYGLSPRVKATGDLQLSFGKMTLPHQLARLVLLEQIYRACAINNHSKYHK